MREDTYTTTVEGAAAHALGFDRPFPVHIARESDVEQAVDALALQHTCESCGALPGDPCIDGQPRERPHSTRAPVADSLQEMARVRRARAQRFRAAHGLPVLP